MQKMPIQELTGPFSLLVVDAVVPLVATVKSLISVGHTIYPMKILGGAL